MHTGKNAYDDHDDDSNNNNNKYKYWEYTERGYERACANACGACLCVVVGLLTVTWVFNAFELSSVADAPPFARTLLWLPLAHHTNAWDDWRRANQSPPPPPDFS